MLLWRESHNPQEVSREVILGSCVQMLDVLNAQLRGIASDVNDWKNVVIAYEPVWAIGTGKASGIFNLTNRSLICLHCT